MNPLQRRKKLLSFRADEIDGIEGLQQGRLCERKPTAFEKEMERERRQVNRVLESQKEERTDNSGFVCVFEGLKAKKGK